MLIYRIMEKKGVEVWFYLDDPPKQVRCFQGVDEVRINLETLQILSFTADQKSGKFLNKALNLVTENQRFLLQKWDEYNE